MSKKIIIIGSGIAGLSTALRLSRKGFKVKVLEKNSYIGGKVSEFKEKGYRFDMGPSLFTMPELVDELADKNNLSDNIFFKYLKLDIACRYFFNDGVLINGYVDINNTSDDLYSVEIDGNFAFSLSGNTFNNDYELSAGSHVIVATQQTGFLLWPTVKTSNLSVQQCEHYSVVFP